LSVDLLAVWSGLNRDQRGPEHLSGVFADLGDRFGNPHATLVAGRGFFEFALAATAGVDLAFHNPDRAAQGFGGRLGIRSPQHRYAF